MEKNIFEHAESKRLSDIFEDSMALDAILTENGGELTPELEELLAENVAALAKKMDGYAYAVRAEKAAQAALAEEIKRLQALKKTHENTEKRIREYLAWNMERVGADRINGTLSKAWFSKTSVLSADEDTLLKPYVPAMEAFRTALPSYVKVTLSVDKTALKGELDGGKEIAGAIMVPGKSLTIK